MRLPEEIARRAHGLFALADQLEARLAAAQRKVDALKRLPAETAAELDALLPAILDKSFKRKS
jgi:hypothetical protein